MFEQCSVVETIEKLKSDGQSGLSVREAGERLRRDERNEGSPEEDNRGVISGAAQ